MSTFCVVVGKTLLVSTCPLDQGRCYWQHVVTNHCKYSESLAEHPDIKEFCARTGREEPTEEDRSRLFNKLRDELRTQ